MVDLNKTINKAVSILTPESLLEVLTSRFKLTSGTKFVVAYSGGCDSQILLHLLSTVRKDSEFSILAAHFDHGLHSDSSLWAEQCGSWAREWAVDFVSVRKKIDQGLGQNFEANARSARYKWLAEISDPDQVVLTAHHGDDQVETFLMRLFQGKSFHQLSGIEERRKITRNSNIELIRPLLCFGKKDIQDYALEHKLDWIDDPSNAENGYYRNFIRNEVFPVLSARNPGIRKKILSAVSVCTQLSNSHIGILENLVEQARTPSKRTVFCYTDPLNLQVLSQKWVDYGSDLLRLWLSNSRVSPPSQMQLEEFCSQLSKEIPANGELRFNDRVIRYYDGHVFLLPFFEDSVRDPIDWNGKAMFLESINLWVELDIQVQFQSTPGFKLGWRRGGEKLTLPGRLHQSSLKSLFQQNRIPPWERQHLPFVLYNDQICWVNGIGATQLCYNEFKESAIKLNFSRLQD